MTAEELEQRAEDYANSHYMTNRPSSSEIEEWKEIQKHYIAGVNMLLDTEQWKNLYAEGLEVGMKMLRDYEGQLKTDAGKWKELIEKLIVVRNNYTDQEWADKYVKDEINRDIVWAVSLLTKYEVNW